MNGPTTLGDRGGRGRSSPSPFDPADGDARRHLAIRWAQDQSRRIRGRSHSIIERPAEPRGDYCSFARHSSACGKPGARASAMRKPSLSCVMAQLR